MAKKQICPRFDAVCPQKFSKSKKTCFIIMEYDEKYSGQIEKMLRNGVRKALKLNPVLGKDIRKQGSTDLYCSRVCKPIQECAQCIADLTYLNTNVGYEIGIAQGYHKPIIITRFTPKPVELEKTEKDQLKKLAKSGSIQYVKMPIDIPADITAVYRADYKNSKELLSKLHEFGRFKRTKNKKIKR